LTAATWLPPEAPWGPVCSGVENDAMHSAITIRQLRLDECEVTLAEAIDAADPSARLLVPFEATWRGRPVLVTAVLERTAVCHPADAAGDPDERLVARRAELLVETNGLRWVVPGVERRRGAFEVWVKEAPRRCSACGRTPSETAFRAYKAAYCIRLQPGAPGHDRPAEAPAGSLTTTSGRSPGPRSHVLSAFRGRTQ
jgi:hypothetical protein